MADPVQSSPDSDRPKTVAERIAMDAAYETLPEPRSSAGIAPKRPDSIYSRFHLENWTDDDFAKHSATTRKTLAYLIELEAAMHALAQPSPTPADEIIGQIEERFPDWRGFRDLVDCIDVTLHRLRGGS